MAHKGNPFPVLFRRDWNLNVNNNNNGWANRYIAKLFKGTTGFGTLATQFTYDCGPSKVTFVSQNTWESQVVHFGLFDFQVKLHADIAPGQSTYINRCELIEQHVGQIAEWRMIEDGTQVIGFFQTLTAADLYWDPAWFDSEPFLINSLIRPKTWSDGPPH